MGSIKDRNGRNLIEAEDIKKNWQEYTEKLYKKDLHDPADVGNLISGSSAFSKTSLNILKFTVHIFLKPGLQNFEHYFTSM